MIVYNKMKDTGTILINVFDKNKNSIYKKILFNQITANFRNEFVKSLIGQTANVEISQLAFGSGISTPNESNQLLDNELYRISDTDLYISSTGQVTSAFYITGEEYISIVPSGEIKEIGFFAGSSAQSYNSGLGLNTGLLVSRLLWSYTIEEENSIYIQRIDTLTA